LEVRSDLGQLLGNRIKDAIERSVHRSSVGLVIDPVPQPARLPPLARPEAMMQAPRPVCEGFSTGARGACPCAVLQGDDALRLNAPVPTFLQVRRTALPGQE